MEYSDSDKRFMAAFSNGIKDIHVVSAGFSWNCPECLNNYDICCEHKGEHMYQKGEIVDEGSFSHNACDICGSKLGGNRFSAHGVLDTDHKEIVHLEVCVDCIMYMANGDLPEVWE